MLLKIIIDICSKIFPIPAWLLKKIKTRFFWAILSNATTYDHNFWVGRLIAHSVVSNTVGTESLRILYKHFVHKPKNHLIPHACIVLCTFNILYYNTYVVLDKLSMFNGPWNHDYLCHLYAKHRRNFYSMYSFTSFRKR